MREINYLKPIDKGFYRNLASYQVVICVNSEVASKVISLGSRAFGRKANAT